MDAIHWFVFFHRVNCHSSQVHVLNCIWMNYWHENTGFDDFDNVYYIIEELFSSNVHIINEEG